jgi:hypothetical protein
MTTTPDRRAEPDSAGVHLPRQHADEPAAATLTTPASAPATAADAVSDTGTGPGRPRDIPRWVRWTVLPLLVLVPLGYVIISAEQSRDDGESKQAEAAARHLIRNEPSSLQQRIYQVPIPDGATGVGYLETNSWDTSVLYARFTTTAGGLDTFLAKIGTTRDALREGRSAITPAQAGAVGWRFTSPVPWAGVSLHQAGDKPDHDITVDLADADAPIVFVVSTVNFQHGFGGG